MKISEIIKLAKEAAAEEFVVEEKTAEVVSVPESDEGKSLRKLASSLRNMDTNTIFEESMQDVLAGKVSELVKESELLVAEKGNSNSETLRNLASSFRKISSEIKTRTDNEALELYKAAAASKQLKQLLG